MQIINQDSNGNINMLLVGGDVQYDGKIEVVSLDQSDRLLEVRVYPDSCSEVCRASRGDVVAKTFNISRDHYYPEKFFMGNTVMKFYRHNSLTASEAYLKLFNGYLKSNGS